MVNSCMKQILTVDLGGTNIRVALVTSEGKLEYSQTYATMAKRGPRKIIDAIADIIRDTIDSKELITRGIMSIAIAAAGILDIKNGIVTSSPNLPGWENIHLKEILADKLGLQIYLINDASAAALGEHRLGAGIGINNLVFLTVSTGIGGGIIIDNELYIGSDGCAGELGHMIVESNGPRCLCGSSGCLEIMASGTALAHDMIARINNGDKSAVLNLVDGNIGNITAEKIAFAARSKDVLACEVIDRAAFYLGVGMTNIINIFNPEMIIIGGGLSKLGEKLLKPARRIVKQRALTFPSRKVRIVRARLGDNAGTLGAALYALGNSVS